jgi:hypothetical protein
VIQVVGNPISQNKMKHSKLHAHYLRQLVQEKVVTLIYYNKNAQFTNIFTKHLSEAKLIKLCTMLGIEEAAIMGGCHVDLISPPESP